MDAPLVDLVWQRAEGRCEYCRLPQAAASVVRFQLEHIRSKQHGGLTVAENLALSCPRCNCFKGPNLTGIDPETDAVVLLFNPRQDQWPNHFALVDAEIRGLTPIGRTTVNLLRMNDPERVELRSQLLAAGEF
jgi:5-methylcytosine-specific restriction endonuclease McrA